MPLQPNPDPLGVDSGPCVPGQRISSRRATWSPQPRARPQPVVEKGRRKDFPALVGPRLLRSSAHVATVTQLLSPRRWFFGHQPRAECSRGGRRSKGTLGRLAAPHPRSAEVPAGGHVLSLWTSTSWTKLRVVRGSAAPVSDALAMGMADQPRLLPLREPRAQPSRKTSTATPRVLREAETAQREAPVIKAPRSHAEPRWRNAPAVGMSRA